MTNEEAIETLKRNYPPEYFEQLREAVDMAIEALKGQDVSDKIVSALEKQIPKKVRIEYHPKYGCAIFCPNCKRMDVGLWNYCPSCGQALASTDEEDTEVAQ